MKRIIMFFGLLFTVAFFSVSFVDAGDSVRDVHGKGLLKMSILSSSGNTPLSGVKVTAKQGKTVLSAVTDKKGYARLSLSSGSWKVSLELKGWQSQSNTVKIEPGRFIGYEVKLQPAGAKPTSASWLPSSGGLIPGRF